MRKYLAGPLLLFIIFLLPYAALANSGPVFWQGYPYSDMMLVEDGCPIAVLRETLLFDFSAEQDAPYTISGRVVASYEMFNPTHASQSVQMAFPFVESIHNLSLQDVVITADGSRIPYDLYVGDVVHSYVHPFQGNEEKNIDFTRVISTITDEIYSAESFAENEKGKLYLIKVKPTGFQGVNFAVDFALQEEKTRVLTKSFNRYEREGEKTRLTAWCYGPELLEIFVLGEDIDLRTAAYRDGQLKEKTGLFIAEISSQEMELKPYLMDLVKSNIYRNYQGLLSEVQLYNLYGAALDRHFKENAGFCAGENLFEQEHFQRLFTLVYWVDFSPQETREITVRYNTNGTMDLTRTGKPLYTFSYILNPAKNWREFGELQIIIIPPAKAPYLVESSIGLNRGENGIYQALLPGLPEGDLFFSLYENEKISLLDQTKGSLRRHFGALAPMVALLMVVIIPVLIIYKIRVNLSRSNRY
ncbi:MAG: hypothetical protein GX779_03865 [Clostridia bacterium]|nr:hypothetical protein [Clostridia bacterium]